MRVVLSSNTDFFIQISKMSIVSISRKELTTYYTRRGIWRCYFTHKLYLHSPSACKNTDAYSKNNSPYSTLTRVISLICNSYTMVVCCHGISILYHRKMNAGSISCPEEI